MSQNSDVFCDFCNKEISKTKYASEYYINLSNIAKKNETGACFMMGWVPDFTGQKDFCGLECLKNWILEKVK